MVRKTKLTMEETNKTGRKSLTEEQINEKYQSYVNRIQIKNIAIEKANLILPTDKKIKICNILGLKDWMKYKLSLYYL